MSEVSFSKVLPPAALLAALAAACGGPSTPSPFVSGEPDGGSPSSSGAPAPSLGAGSSASSSSVTGGGGCTGIACAVPPCAGGGTTTISGTVYDPAGKNPLYDVGVFVPQSAVQPMPSGATCDCASLYTGDPLVSALTDASGHFTLQGVPSGANVPLVVQVGKWRMQTTLANVTACQDNPQPAGTLRLPRNRAEGDIPNVAISTGGADSLECLLRRVGVDAAEYGPGGSGAGHLHIFTGASELQGVSVPGVGMLGTVPDTSPSAPTSASALWDSSKDLAPYDMVLLSCEGQETSNMNQQALFDYAAAGGRVFASHFHYAWFDTGPFGAANLATWTTGSNDMGNIGATIVTSFPKGQALAQWLGNVGALSSGELPIQEARHNADVGASNTVSQAWISADSSASPPQATEYFTFNTPIGVDATKQCGRVVYSDLHVGAASNDYAADPLDPIVPTGCGDGDLSPQEKALEFMLFDLSACVISDGQAPSAPPVTAPK